MNKSSLMYCTPYICTLQRMNLYETTARFYLVGSNNTQTRFRVLKIDRTEPRDLVITEDNIEYNAKEIRDLLLMIDTGNRSKLGHKSSGFNRNVSAYGIVGFVRFMEGYYMILITKRRVIAQLGHHAIYKIEDTKMVYIPNEYIKLSHPDEQKYLKAFQSMDLSSNFYFSYSYDLTNTLQFNLTPVKLQDFKDYEETDDVQNPEGSFGKLGKPKVYGVRYRPYHKFVWNWHLLKPVMGIVHHEWLLYLIYGFVTQSNLCIYGKSVFITLIARRSRKYAGTRFLKRGANFRGDVANEVETEQIVSSCVSSFTFGQHTSFVQLRGSVPAYWSQDNSKMVAKPPIGFDLADPYHETAGRHFNRLMCRYGSPIIIINLVKKRENRRHESLLSEDFFDSVNYLNQFLPVKHRLQYIAFDMARINKLKEDNVLPHLHRISLNVLRKVGIFMTSSPSSSRKYPPNWEFWDMKSRRPTMTNDQGRTIWLQTGVPRVNCVDCLDRTNTAQFSLGKCALAFQLYALGVMDTLNIEFDSDCARMLEDLYEDHGDTLALQYGGSQLVHRIKTYRKTAPWTSQGNDIMQTLSRYYSNTFSDAEKQNAMNLFLGVFIPRENGISLWDLSSDYPLHHRFDWSFRSKSCWFNPQLLGTLPLPVDIFKKEIMALSTNEEKTDAFIEHYRPYELAILTELLAWVMSHSIRNFMPSYSTNFSPFVSRVDRSKENVDQNKKIMMRNPSLSGISSTSSTSSHTSSSEFDDSESEYAPDRDLLFDRCTTPSLQSSSCNSTVNNDPYGVKHHEVAVDDMKLYAQYADSYWKPIEPIDILKSSHSVDEPKVSKQNIDIYTEHISRIVKGFTPMMSQDHTLFVKYVCS